MYLLSLNFFISYKLQKYVCVLSEPIQALNTIKTLTQGKIQAILVKLQMDLNNKSNI
jgi:hypothetical protein